MGGNSFYNGQNSKETIVNIMNDKDSPEIEYITEFLTPKELAELYSTCDVLVHPYRGEGFGMPILEAMATGLPVMVTNGGACLDFCNHNNSILLNAEKVFYKEKRVGDDATVGHPWMYEVSREDLKTKMYACFKSSAELISNSNIAYKNVHENYSWEHVATLVKERIFNLKDKVPFRSMNSAEDLNFEELLAEVNVAYENRNFDRTIELIEKIIFINGFNSLENSSNIKADLLSISGLSYLNLGLIESAQNCFEEALTINPASSQACFGIGEVFYNAEMLEESKTMFEWAVVNDNQNKNANIRLQQVNSKLNLPENHNTLFLEETVSKEV
jgi:tetratricopeptide (TPR) repeat protein